MILVIIHLLRKEGQDNLKERTDTLLRRLGKVALLKQLP